MPTSRLAILHCAPTGTSLRWGLWQQHELEQPTAPSCSAPCHAKRPARRECERFAGRGVPQTCWGTWSYLPPQPRAPNLSSKAPPYTKKKHPVTTPGQQPMGEPPIGEETSPLLSTSPHWSIGLSPALPCPHRDTQLLDTGTILFPLLKLNFVLAKYSLGYTGEVFCTLVVRGLI